MKTFLFLLILLSLSICTYAQIPTTGLVAYYPFNGNANDSSANANNGTINGAVLTSDRFGNANSAYSFDGVASNITVPHSSSLVVSNNTFSYSFWMKVNTWQTNTLEYYVFSKHSGSGASQSGYHSYIYQSAFTMRYRNGNTSNWGATSSLSNPTAGSWFHIVFTVDNTSNKTYLNGVLVDTQPSQIVGANTNNLTFGYDPFGGQHYSGSLDDIRIYNTSLTPAEVTQLYNETQPVSNCQINLNNGLIAKYDFNGNANDASGNAHNGTVNGATLTNDRFGNPNSAYDFTNSADKIVVANSTDLSLTGDFGFNFWVNVRSYNGALNAIISKMESGSCNHYGYFMGMMSWTGENKIEFQCDPICSNASAYLPNNDGVLLTNQWYNIGITYNEAESKLKYYKNGVLIDSIIEVLDIQNTAYDLIIGNHVNYPYTLSSPGGNFDGVIDDIRIYNRELTACEMDSLYTPAQPPIQCSINLNTGLVAKYDFNGNANDLSGNANDGTVNNATLTNDRFGNSNAAYIFDGSTSYIEVPHSSSLAFASNAISVSFWANIYSVPGSGYSGLILSKQSGSGTTMQGFNVYDNTNLTTGLMISNGGGNIAWLNTPLVLNEYHHFAYTYYNGVGYSYLDGVQVGSETGQTATIGANTMNMLIGKANWSNINALNFHGVIDEMSIYNRELTVCEIDSLYNMPNTTPCTVPNIVTGIVGANTICSNSASTYTLAPVNGATSYIWTLPNGWSGTSTTNTITLTPNGSGGNISVTANNSCGNSTPNTFLVNINATPIVSIVSSSSSLCAGQYATLTASGASSYSWNTGANTQTISVNPSLPTSYTVVGTTNGCSNSFVFNQAVSNCSVNPSNQICFNSAISYTNTAPNNLPNSVTSGDFNGDGNLDIARVSTNSNQVSISLGNGSGVFSAAINYPLASGSYPVSICAADFNGDSKIDIATANVSSDNVSVLLGVGDGSFGAYTNFSVGTGPQSVCYADFNSDGLIDLATANNGSNNVSILLGTGSGTFNAASSFSCANGPTSILNADFNGDTKIDLATSNPNSSDVSVLLGTGTGVFGTATNFLVGTNPYSLCTADFNGDNKIDLATSNLNSNNVSILLGTGTGSFGIATNFNVNNIPYAICTTDFNGDGRKDVATSSVTGIISVLLGHGNGSFGTFRTFAAGTNSVNTIINADFNGDSKYDLATESKVLINSTNNIAISATSLEVCAGNSSTLTANGSPSYIWSTGETATSILVSPTATTTYSVSDGIGCSDTVSITISINCVGVNEFEILPALKTYPNPIQNKVNLEFASQEISDMNIEVFNLLGTCVYTKNTSVTTGENKVELNLSELTEGIYLLKFGNKLQRIQVIR